MRYILQLVILIGFFAYAQADMLSSMKEKVKTIGKQTPIDIEVYAKNPSTQSVHSGLQTSPTHIREI